MTTSGSGGRSASQDRSTAELLHSVREDLGVLVREELQSARAELGATARRARRAGGLLGVAAGLGVLTSAMSGVVVLRVLERFLPPTAAAVVATALFGAATAATARVGIVELRRAGPLLPQHTLASLEADVEAVVDAVSDQKRGPG